MYKQFMLILIAPSFQISIKQTTRRTFLDSILVDENHDDFNINDFLTIPNTAITDAKSLLKPSRPIFLSQSTTVKVPPFDELKRHTKSATLPYCPPDLNAITNFTSPEGFEVQKIIDDKHYGTLVLLGANHNNSELIVSHRGSKSFQSWLYDISWQLIDMPNTPPGVQVHQGFWDYYQANANEVRDFLRSRMSDQMYKNYTIIFTGHSLGAASATFNAVELGPWLNEQSIKYKLFSISSPRVGNQAFRDYAISLNFPMLRYSNKRDPIPQLPPREFHFVHLPGEVHMPPSEKGQSVVYCSQKYDEDPQCAFKYRYMMNPFNHLYTLNQRFPYFCRIEKILSKIK